MNIYLLIVIAFSYLAVTVFAIYRIYSSNLLGKQQKLINTIMVILIPFLWLGVLSIVLKPAQKGTSSKEYRDNKGKVKYKNHGNGAF